MPEKLKPIIGFALVAAIALVAGFYVGSSRVAEPVAEADTLLSAAVFTDLQGHPAKLADWGGKPRILNFWATWCAPCRLEMPLLNQFQTAHKDELQILGVAIDSAENVAKFREQVAIVFPIVLGDAQTLDLMRKLGNSSGALPFSLFLDRQGRIQGTHLGPLTTPALEDALAKLRVVTPGQK